MNTYPPLTNIRNYLSDEFFRLRTQAMRDSLWSKLTGKNTALAAFPEQAPRKSPNRKLIGLQDIPVEQIIGTLGRQSDFDHKFRPLKRYLVDRWVNVYLTAENGGWPPIVVHKVEEKYYVEDGHHRVSVARLFGMGFIQAKVWEYPAPVRPAKKCRPVQCTERSSAKVYAVQ